MEVDRVLRGAVASGLVTVAACRDCDDPLPPSPEDADIPNGLHVREARFIDPEVIELAFSEPLAPVDGVDPQKFRLSMAMGEKLHDRGHCDWYTSYCDLSFGFDDFGCAQCGHSYDSGSDDCPEPTLVTSLVGDSEDDARLHLRISPPLDPLRCVQLEYVGPDASIIVHFSALGVPTITGRSGATLDDIAAHWVIPPASEQSFEEGRFPSLPVMVRVQCPEEF